MIIRFFLFSILIILFLTGDLYASGAVAKRGQAQQRAMQSAQQKAMMQKVMVEQQMMQKAVAEKAIAEQRRLQQQAAAELAVRKLQKQKVQTRVLQHTARTQIEQQVRTEALLDEVNVDVSPPEQAKEVADFDEVVGSLNQSSYAWPLIIDREAKEMLVYQYIQQYRQQGIVIRNPPVHYVGMVDSMTQQAPDMLDQPFPQILQLMAVMEYDFDNGRNKDAMARQVLGEKAYHQNVERLKQRSF